MTALAYGHRKNGRWTVGLKKRAAPDGSRNATLARRTESNVTRLVHRITLAETDAELLRYARQIQQISRRPS